MRWSVKGVTVATEPDLDALGLLAVRRRMSILFGSVEAAPALVRARMKSAMNQMPDADLVLDLERATTPVDYFAGLRLAAIEGDTVIPRFTGSVVSAQPTDEGVAVSALGAVSLVERLIGGMVSRNISPGELFHLLARSGGLREEQLNVEGLDQLARETFEVVTPVDGVEIDEAVDFAGVRFLPASIGRRALSALDVRDELRAEFGAPAYALALVTAQRMFDAEEEGLAHIDLALAWLTVRLRYGLAVLPDGSALAFERSESLTKLARRGIVAVRALGSTRQWLRQPEVRERPNAIPLDERRPRLEAELPELSLQERQALLALTRASSEPDLLARVHALWEAIEFYASGGKVPPLFDKGSLNAIRAALPPDLADEQRARALDRIGHFNDPPLMVRLRALLDSEGVPIADGELELLLALRALRNDVVHGRKTDLPAVEDVEYAISVVARMLVYRVAALKSRPS